TLAATQSDPTAGNIPVDPNAASSTAPADTHGDTKPDTSNSDAASAATPPADASGSQQPLTPPPIAAALAFPVIATTPSATDGNQTGTENGNGNASAGGTVDAGQLAALSGAIKAGAPRGKADGADTKPVPGDAGTASDGSANPGAKAFDAARLTPALTPQPPQNAPLPPTGQGQPTAGDGSQTRNADVASTTQAATNHARQLAATGQATGANAAPQTGPTPDPAAGPNADSTRDPSAKPIEDVTRQALEAAVRHTETPTTEPPASPPGSVQAASTPQAADGTGGALAPALSTTSAAQTAAPATAASPPAVPISGLAVEIAAQAHAGRSRFDIRLDPPELGRVDVRLNIDRQGKVTSRVIVDRQETLDILRREAPELQRSLQQAGLKTADDNALQFSLRDNGTSGGFNNFGGYNPYPNNDAPAGATRVIIADRDLPPVDAAGAGYGRTNGSSAGVDIRV
ncbi:MAG TPA: flagellar hook-length control protein FliK, partial [Xanthobacteraceae bacterium]